MQLKIENDHYLLEGSIAIDPTKQANEIEEDQCTGFSFPESMAEGHVDGNMQSWSATSISAITTYLE